MYPKLLMQSLFIIHMTTLIESDSNITDFKGLKESESSSRILSRRKRYLVFPDGSSFQLVFCTQNMGYINPRGVIWFGNTAALAWELPTDPNLFYAFKDLKGNYALRRQDVQKHIYFLDDKGKVISKVKYDRKPIVNPAFAKRSVDNQERNRHKFKLGRKEMHKMQRNLTYFENLDAKSLRFHRESRISLFAKIEILLEGMGKRGRECVLQLLCENSRRKDQGTFLGEIMKTVFTLPKLDDFISEEDKQYNEAYATKEECRKLFPHCNIQVNTDDILTLHILK